MMGEVVSANALVVYGLSECMEGKEEEIGR